MAIESLLIRYKNVPDKQIAFDTLVLLINQYQSEIDYENRKEIKDADF